MAFVNVQGEVSRLHNSGGGFGLKETWQTKDGERARYWAVFPKDAVQVQPGQVVKVSGGLQTSVTDPKPDREGIERVYVDHVVGQAKVEVVGASQGGHSASSEPFTGGSSSGDAWAAPGGAQGFNNSAPF